MLIFPFKTIRFSETIFFLNVLVLLVHESETGGSTATLSRGRSRSMSSLPRITKSKPITQSRPASISSSSSTVNEADVNPLASTSDFKEVDVREHQHLIEKTKHVSFATHVDLAEASEGTQSDHLIPSRDGVFARVRRILLRNAAPVAVGAAIGGVGVGAGISQLFNTTTTTQKSTTSNYSDTIINIME